MKTLLLSIVILTSHLAPWTDCDREYRKLLAAIAEMEADGGYSKEWISKSKIAAKKAYEECKKRNPRAVEVGTEQ